MPEIVGLWQIRGQTYRHSRELPVAGDGDLYVALFALKESTLRWFWKLPPRGPDSHVVTQDVLSKHVIPAPNLLERAFYSSTNLFWRPLTIHSGIKLWNFCCDLEIHMIKKGEKSDVPFCYLTSLRQAVAVNNHYPTEDIRPPWIWLPQKCGQYVSMHCKVSEFIPTR